MTELSLFIIGQLFLHHRHIYGWREWAVLVILAIIGAVFCLATEGHRHD